MPRSPASAPRRCGAAAACCAAPAGRLRTQDVAHLVEVEAEFLEHQDPVAARPAARWRSSGSRSAGPRVPARTGRVRRRTAAVAPRRARCAKVTDPEHASAIQRHGVDDGLLAAHGFCHRGVAHDAIEQCRKPAKAIAKQIEADVLIGDQVGHHGEVRHGRAVAREIVAANAARPGTRTFPARLR